MVILNTELSAAGLERDLHSSYCSEDVIGLAATNPTETVIK
jgi:hypothetical protein